MTALDYIKKQFGAARPPLIPLAGRRSLKYLKPQELAVFKNLLFDARTIVEGAFAGRHRSPYRGSAPEFVDYREYNPGDEISTIDWKAYARTDRYYIRLFEKETDMNCYLLVDNSKSMSFGGAADAKLLGEQVSKREYAFRLAAALLYLMIRQGDRCGLTLFSEQLDAHFPRGGTMSHVYRTLSALERTHPGGRTDLSRVLRQCYPLFPRRGLLILISDLLDEPAEIFQALNLFLHRRFEVILFHVLHPAELELPRLSSVNFIDAEAHARITVQPNDIRASYQTKLREFIQTLRELSRARGIDYNLIDTATPYQEALRRYLIHRKR